MKYHQAMELHRYARDILSQYAENYIGELNKECDSFINGSTNLEFYVVSDCNGYYLQGVCYHRGELVCLCKDLNSCAMVCKFLTGYLDRFFVAVHGIRQMSMWEALQNG